MGCGMNSAKGLEYLLYVVLDPVNGPVFRHVKTLCLCP